MDWSSIVENFVFCGFGGACLTPPQKQALRDAAAITSKKLVVEVVSGVEVLAGDDLRIMQNLFEMAFGQRPAARAIEWKLAGFQQRNPRTDFRYGRLPLDVMEYGATQPQFSEFLPGDVRSDRSPPQALVVMNAAAVVVGFFKLHPSLARPVRGTPTANRLQRREFAAYLLRGLRQPRDSEQLNVTSPGYSPTSVGRTRLLQDVERSDSVASARSTQRSDDEAYCRAVHQRLVALCWAAMLTCVRVWARMAREDPRLTLLDFSHALERTEHVISTVFMDVVDDSIVRAIPGGF